MKSRKQELQEKITEKTRQWQVLDKTLADLRKAMILESRGEERRRFIDKSQQVEQERRVIEQELEQLGAEYQHAASSEEVVEKPGPVSQEDYLEWLCAQVSQVSLAGIDRKAASRHAEAYLNLGAIYTALLTLSAEHEGDFPLEGGKGDVMRREMRAERRVSALAQLNRRKHLVLLGDPGSGKSTFVNFVVMCLAGELLNQPRAGLGRLTDPLPAEKDEKKPPPQPWDHGALLPVRVILRDFAARGLPPADHTATAEHLWDFITHDLENAALGGYAPQLRQKVLDEGGILLLDGLDEVPEAEQRRAQMTQVVEDLAKTFPNCRVVVTSRTYAYQKQDWKLRGFIDTVLAPFTRGQIRYFVEHWYRHIGMLRGMNADDAQGRAELLKRAILSSERLYRFAERPLLLTLMASLHAWRGGSLPEKREELYNDTVDLLLDWWESSKMVRDAKGQLIIEHESLSAVLEMGKESVQKALSTLAFHAHASQTEIRGTADISEEDLVSELMRLSQRKDMSTGDLLKNLSERAGLYLSERAGLLVPHGVGVYTFPHRTFQEYLAACHLTNEDDFPDNIAELARQDPNRWREVLLLAGAKAARGAASSIWLLAQALCYRDVEDTHTTVEDAWGALLAGQALEETADLTRISPRNRAKANRIRHWLVAILTERQPESFPFPAIERALAGNILAVLGDPRPGVGLREDGLPDIEWCEIPAGSFLMGSDPEKDKEAFSWEQPQHEVHVSAYQISRYPVTNVQYRVFVEDGGYTKKGYWTEEGWEWKEKENLREPDMWGGVFDLPNHPVVMVSWYEAVAFCRWLTNHLREKGELSDDEEVRLLTEAEWEKAARGDDGRIYPWGNEVGAEYANYTETGLGVTSAMGCFPRGTSLYGCEDMAGNVWEWCVDDWHDNYNGALADGSAWISGGSGRVGRGGSWFCSARYVRCAYRGSNSPSFRSFDLGFRLARKK